MCARATVHSLGAALHTWHSTWTKWIELEVEPPQWDRVYVWRIALHYVSICWPLSLVMRVYGVLSTDEVFLQLPLWTTILETINFHWVGGLLSEHMHVYRHLTDWINKCKSIQKVSFCHLDWITYVHVGSVHVSGHVWLCVHMYVSILVGNVNFWNGYSISVGWLAGILSRFPLNNGPWPM